MSGVIERIPAPIERAPYLSEESTGIQVRSMLGKVKGQIAPDELHAGIHNIKENGIDAVDFKSLNALSIKERGEYWAQFDMDAEDQFELFKEKVDSYIKSIQDKNTGGTDVLNALGFTDAESMFDKYFDGEESDSKLFVNNIFKNLKASQIKKNTEIISELGIAFGEMSSIIAKDIAEGLKNLEKNPKKFERIASEQVNDIAVINDLAIEAMRDSGFWNGDGDGDDPEPRPEGPEPDRPTDGGAAAEPDEEAAVPEEAQEPVAEPEDGSELPIEDEPEPAGKADDKKAPKPSKKVVTKKATGNATPAVSLSERDDASEITEEALAKILAQRAEERARFVEAARVEMQQAMDERDAGAGEVKEEAQPAIEPVVTIPQPTFMEIIGDADGVPEELTGDDELGQLVDGWVSGKSAASTTVAPDELGEVDIASLEAEGPPYTTDHVWAVAGAIRAKREAQGGKDLVGAVEGGQTVIRTEDGLEMVDEGVAGIISNLPDPVDPDKAQASRAKRKAAREGGRPEKQDEPDQEVAPSETAGVNVDTTGLQAEAMAHLRATVARLRGEDGVATPDASNDKDDNDVFAGSNTDFGSFFGEVIAEAGDEDDTDVVAPVAEPTTTLVTGTPRWRANDLKRMDSVATVDTDKNDPTTATGESKRGLMALLDWGSDGRRGRKGKKSGKKNDDEDLEIPG